MSGIDMLLEEFNNKDLQPITARAFKDLALILKDLPLPINLQLVDRLLRIRKVYARKHTTN